MIPKGFRSIQVEEVYVSDREVVILGRPEESDDETSDHNCNVMGCGSVGWHVIMRLKREGGT